jgi:hypothetical protein
MIKWWFRVLLTRSNFLIFCWNSRYFLENPSKIRKIIWNWKSLQKNTQVLPDMRADMRAVSDPNAKIKNLGFYHGVASNEELKSYDLNCKWPSKKMHNVIFMRHNFTTKPHLLYFRYKCISKCRIPEYQMSNLFQKRYSWWWYG